MKSVTLHAGIPGPVLRPGIAVRWRTLDLRSEEASVKIPAKARRRLARRGRLRGPARIITTENGTAVVVPASPTFADVLVHVAVQGEATVRRGAAAIWYRGELVQLHPGAVLEYERVTGGAWTLAFDGDELTIRGSLGLADARRTRTGDWARDDLRLWATQSPERAELPSLTSGISWVSVWGRPVPIPSPGSASVRRPGRGSVGRSAAGGGPGGHGTSRA